MKKYELLAGWLDGGLSPAEEREFQAMLATDPELAGELERMRGVEDMLSFDADLLPSESFLRNVEDTVAARIANDRELAPALPPDRRPFLMPLLGVLLVGGSLLTYFVLDGMDSRELPMPAPAAQRTVSAQPPPAAPAAVETPAPTPAAYPAAAPEPAAMADARRERSLPAERVERRQPQEKETRSDALARTSDVKLGDMISEQLGELNTRIADARKSGNTLMLSEYLRKYGFTAMSSRLPGELEQGLERLEESARLARSLSLPEKEASALGTAGRISMKLGRSADALRSFESASELLRSLDRDASEWEHAAEEARKKSGRR